MPPACSRNHVAADKPDSKPGGCRAVHRAGDRLRPSKLPVALRGCRHRRSNESHAPALKRPSLHERHLLHSRKQPGRDGIKLQCGAHSPRIRMRFPAPGSCRLVERGWQRRGFGRDQQRDHRGRPDLHPWVDRERIHIRRNIRLCAHHRHDEPGCWPGSRAHH